jgi:hypothetical protein
MHDVLSFLAKCRGTDVYQATVQALVQAFASKHSLRRDVSTAMIYNPKDRSIPLPSLRSGAGQKTSCLNICKTVESIMRAYHRVVGGCSRGESHSGGGFTPHPGRFAAAG